MSYSGILYRAGSIWLIPCGRGGGQLQLRFDPFVCVASIGPGDWQSVCFSDILIQASSGSFTGSCDAKMVLPRYAFKADYNPVHVGAHVRVVSFVILVMQCYRPALLFLRRLF